MTNRKWTEAELQQIKGLGLPIKKTQRELELEQQVNTLAAALEQIVDTKDDEHQPMVHSVCVEIAEEALQSIKESPREEQT